MKELGIYANGGKGRLFIFFKFNLQSCIHTVLQLRRCQIIIDLLPITEEPFLTPVLYIVLRQASQPFHCRIMTRNIAHSSLFVSNDD